MTQRRQARPCFVDEARVKQLEQARDDAKTDEERKVIEDQLDEARVPMCAPYGAPPARRRIV